MKNTVKIELNSAEYAILLTSLKSNQIVFQTKYNAVLPQNEAERDYKAILGKRISEIAELLEKIIDAK